MRAIREHASGRLSPLGHIATERKTDARSLDNLWLSATNSWGGATRGLRTPELFRQQRGMVKTMILHQGMGFWSTSWMPPLTEPAAAEHSDQHFGAS
jgi:hypothetical protein